MSSSLFRDVCERPFERVLAQASHEHLHNHELKRNRCDSVQTVRTPFQAQVAHFHVKCAQENERHSPNKKKEEEQTSPTSYRFPYDKPLGGNADAFLIPLFSNLTNLIALNADHSPFQPLILFTLTPSVRSGTQNPPLSSSRCSFCFASRRSTRRFTGGLFLRCSDSSCVISSSRRDMYLDDSPGLASFHLCERGRWDKRTVMSHSIDPHQTSQQR